MERPEAVQNILFNCPDKLTDRARKYVNDITILGSYIRLLEEELKEAKIMKDAKKNFEALHKIHDIIQDTLGITGMPRA